MRERVRSVFVCCILVFSIFVTVDVTYDFIGEVQGATLYVNLTGSAGYSQIQDAIDDANPGDTIFVYKGLYFENVVIDKSLKIIGEDKENTIIDGTGDLKTVIIGASNVHFEGFTLEIDETDMSGDFHLLDMPTSYNVVRECIFNDVPNYAIYTYSSANFNIIENNIFNPYYANGIRCQGNSFNNNYIANNTFNGGKYGISAYSINMFWDNTIINNTFIGDGEFKGISPDSGKRLRIENNSFFNFECGLYLKGSSQCIVVNNTIIDSGWWTIYVTGSSNIFYNNDFIDRDGSGVQIHDASSNTWNASYPLGGNFWSDYNGYDNFSGVGQNLSGSDGIGDTNVTIDPGSIDHYPLMEPIRDFILSGPVHNIDKDTFYNEIQTGIDDADSGDTITVRNGTYNENIIIDKTITLVGEGKDSTFIEGMKDGNVVTLHANWVNITGFRINGSGEDPTDAGLNLNNLNYCTIKENNITGNNYGIYAESCYDNRIYHNIFYDNLKHAYDYGVNIWNLSYPNGGNYWDDWTAPDQDNDSFVDNPRLIEGGPNRDWLPFSVIDFKSYPVFNLDLGTRHPTIQSAIDNAVPGNTIYVTRGTYYENVFVNMTLNLTCDSINGTTIRSEGNSDVLTINANWVNITGFNIKNIGGSMANAGIKIIDSYKCNLYENNFSLNGIGIHLLNSNSIQIFNNDIDNNYFGMYSENSHHNIICENRFIKNDYGPYLIDSRWNNISDNFVSTEFTGFSLRRSNLNTISNNSIIDTRGVLSESWGISLSESFQNEISRNIITDNQAGIYLFESDENDLSENVIINCSDWYGISLRRSVSSIVLENTMINSSIIIEGYLLEHWNSHNIASSNTANGKPVYYLKDTVGGTVPQGVSNIILANCQDIIIENHSISNVSGAIQLGFSLYTEIRYNTIRENVVGIYSESSDYNNITMNNITNNHAGAMFLSSDYNQFIDNNIVESEDYGIYFDVSSWYNSIYHNNFIQNFEQVYDTPTFNTWDNGYPSGGNYWSDYNGEDRFSGPGQNISGKDGIGDSPHQAHANMEDNYPLMDPVRNVTVIRPVHNLNKDTHYFKIQDAIDAADTGDTIFVENGTYKENLIINKTINLSGEDRNGTVIDGGGSGNVIWIVSDYVNITGFSVTNTSSIDYGIYVRSDYNRISNNNIYLCDVIGIYLSYSVGNTLFNNSITNGGVYIYGYYIEYWNTHNITTSNTLNGKPILYLKNQIVGNIIGSFGQIILANCTIGSIINQELMDSYVGIILSYSSYISIENNNISNNVYGIYSFQSNNNIFSENTISNNVYGSYLYDSSNNNITNNYFRWNSEWGLSIFVDSYTNTIHHNDFIENSIQARGLNGYGTKWNETYPLGGNFWSDYEGVDFYKDPDQHTYGSDGYGDTPYEINTNSKDYAPLLGPIKDIFPPEIFLISPENHSVIQPGTIIDYEILDFNQFSVQYSIDSNPQQILLSPYDISTNGWTDGTHSIQLWAKDIFNNSISFIYYFIIDSTKPEIELISPANGSMIPPNTNLDFSIIDLNALHVYYTVNNGSKNLLLEPYDIITTDWEDGIHEIRISAIDIAGNFNTSWYIFSMEYNRPVILLDYPLNNSIISSGLILDFSIYDPNLVHANYSINGNANISFWDPFEISTFGWFEGENKVQINAVDSTNNTNSGWFIFIIDDTKPTIELNSPMNNSVISFGAILDFSIFDINLKHVNFSLNGGPTEKLLSPYNVTTTGWVDGENKILINVIDKAGNANHSWYLFLKDTEPPQIILNSPLNNSVILSGTTIDLNITDPHLLTVNYSVNEDPTIDLFDPFNISTSGWPDGNYSIQIISEDTIGNIGSSLFLFTIDSTKPRIMINSPENNTVIKPGTIIDISINETNLLIVNYTVNGGPESSLFDPFNISTIGWSDGLYIIEIIVQDMAGNINSSFYQFVVDSTLPVIILNSPLNNSIITNGIIWNFSISDTNLLSVNYSINGTPDIQINPPFDISPSGWVDGDFSIHINALDMAGNLGTALYYFTLDSTPPMVVLNDPINDTVITKGSLLDFEVIEDNLLMINYSINGGLEDIFSPPYDLNTLNWLDGEYIILINSSDIAGNRNTSWFRFTIDSTEPNILLNNPIDGSIIPQGTILDFTINESNLLYANYSINGDSEIPFTNPFNISTGGWDDGYYSITIEVIDMVGYSFEALYSFTVDSQPPSILLNSPLNNSLIAAGSILDFIVVDDHIEHVNYSINQDSAIQLDDPYNILTDEWADGEYEVLIEAADFAGNTAKEHFVFVLDSTPPSLEINESWNHTTISVGTKIPFNITGLEGGNLKIIIDGEIYPDNNLPYIIDTTGWEDGEYTILIRANDTIGNEISQWIKVYVDAIKPYVIKTNPSDNAINIGTSTSIEITFNEPIIQTNTNEYISISSIEHFLYEWDDRGKVLSIHFDSELLDGITYTLTIDSQISDINGNPMDSDFILTFTTEYLDSDGDGIPDIDDEDDDNDGLLDTLEDKNGNGKVDLGETDPLNPDSDSDGHNDLVDKYPLDSGRWKVMEEPEESILLWLILLIVIMVIGILLFLFIWKRKTPPKKPEIAEVEVWEEVEEDTLECPECGMEFTEMVSQCPGCGTEFDGVEEEVTFQELKGDIEVI